MSFASSPAFEVWLLIELRRLLAAAEDVLREAARSRLAVGDAERAIELAGRLVAVNGLDEDSQELLIRAYSAAGDRAAAERQRDACIALFQSELGTDPGPAVMRAAEAQALRESTQYVPNRAAIEARLEAALAAQDAGASEAAIASLRAAVTDADDIGDRELQGRALLALGSAAGTESEAGTARAQECCTRQSRSLRRRRRTQSPRRRTANLDMSTCFAGVTSAHGRWLQQATALAAEHPAEAAWAHAVHGAALTDVGRHGDAFNELRQALQLGEMAHDLAVQTWARAFVGRIHLLRGELVEPATRSSGHSRSHASCAGPRLFRCLSRSSPTSTLPKGGSTPPARRTSTRTNSLCNSAIRAGRGSPPGASAWWPRAGATMKRESGGSRWPG